MLFCQEDGCWLTPETRPILRPLSQTYSRTVVKKVFRRRLSRGWRFILHILYEDLYHFEKRTQIRTTPEVKVPSSH